MSRIIAGDFTVGGLPRNNATVKLWPGITFSSVPAKNTAIPTTDPIDSTTTGTSHGADGAYSFSDAPSGICFVSIEWNGLTVWQFHPQQVGVTILSLDDYGADSSGLTDSTAAIQAVVNALQATTFASGQVEIIGNPGTYKISTTISFPNSASNFRFRGTGYRSTLFQWAGASGIPMFLVDNVRGAEFSQFGAIGSIANPPSEIFLCRTGVDPRTGSAAAMENRWERIFAGGYSDNMVGTAFRFIDPETSSGSGNNDQHSFYDVSIQGCSNHGFSFESINTLWHNIVGGQIQRCNISGINNVKPGNTQGGGFRCWGTNFLHVGTMFRLGTSQHTIDIFAPHAESVSGFIYTPTTIIGNFSGARTEVNVFGGSVKCLDGVDHSITFDADNHGNLNLYGLHMSSPNGVTWSFPTSGSFVNVIGGMVVLNTVNYNNRLTIDGMRDEAGATTFVPLTSGGAQLRLITASFGANTNRDVFAKYDGTDLTNPISRLDDTGVLTLRPTFTTLDTLKGVITALPAGKNIQTMLVGTTFGSGASAWVLGDTSFRGKFLGNGIMHGFMAFRPKNQDFYLTGSFSGSGYDDAPVGLTVHGPVTIGAAGLAMTNVLSASGLWDPGTISDGAVANTSVAVTGARVGDPAFAGLTTATTLGLLITAIVTSAGVVGVSLLNKSGGAVTPGQGACRAVVTQF